MLISSPRQNISLMPCLSPCTFPSSLLGSHCKMHNVSPPLLQWHKTCSWGNSKTRQRKREERKRKDGGRRWENKFVMEEAQPKEKERRKEKLGTNKRMSDSACVCVWERETTAWGGHNTASFIYLFILTQSQNVSKYSSQLGLSLSAVCRSLSPPLPLRQLQVYNSCRLMFDQW